MKCLWRLILIGRSFVKMFQTMLQLQFVSFLLQRDDASAQSGAERFVFLLQDASRLTTNRGINPVYPPCPPPPQPPCKCEELTGTRRLIMPHMFYMSVMSR